MVKVSPRKTSAAPLLVDDLDRLYREQSARMWRALTGFCGDVDLASDAVAEAFAQAIARGDAIRSPERWVWKAAYRIAAGELHRQQRQAELVSAPAISDAEPAWEIRAALAKLPPQQRAVVVLHYYAGYGAREIAAITDTTSGAVWMALSRGRKTLRRLLEASDD